MPVRPVLPPEARFLRLSFFAAYWCAILGLLFSLGLTVIGGQVRFWSPPQNTVRDRDPERCLERVRSLATDLDEALADGIEAAGRAPPTALPGFWAFAAGWERTWREVRYGCGLEAAARGSRFAEIARAHDGLLDQRYAVESVVRRYAAAEGPARHAIQSSLVDLGVAP